MMFFSAIRYTNDYLDYKHMKYYIYLYMRKYTRCKDLFFPTSHWVSLFLQVNSGSQLCETGTVAQTWQIQSRPLVSFTPMSQEKNGDSLSSERQVDIGKDRSSPRIVADCLWFARRRRLLWEHYMGCKWVVFGESMVCFPLYPLSTVGSRRAFAKLKWLAASYFTHGHCSFGMLLCDA